MVAVEKAASAVAILLAAAIGVTAAELTWRFAYENRMAIAPPSPALPTGATPPPVEKDYRALTALHLFGEAAPVAKPQATTPDSAPATNLQLLLHGVLQSDDPTFNVAIIADSSGRERPYWIGDKVAGEAVVKQILPYRVLLERNGRLEALDLKKQRAETGAPTGKVAPAVSEPTRMSAKERRKQRAAGDVDSSEAVAVAVAAGGDGRIPRRLLSNPADMAKELTLEPVTVDGELKGYRIDPQNESPRFKDAGLQAGDVITAINGTAVNDAGLLGRLLPQLDTADRFILEVENGGRRRSLTIRVE